MRLRVVAVLALLVYNLQINCSKLNNLHRNLITEIGDAANKTFTARLCLPTATNFTNCFPESSSAEDYAWNSSEIRYPTNGAPWGMHLTGPYPDGRTYLLSWLTGKPSIGHNLIKPNTSQLVTSVKLQIVLMAEAINANFSTIVARRPWITYNGSIITYHRRFTDPDLVSYSYVSPYIHHVVLPNLLPSTTYLYITSGRTGTPNSAIFNFTTLPANSMNTSNGTGSSGSARRYPLRIGIIGDVGQTRNSSATRDQLLSNRPQVVLHLGDNSYADTYNAANPDEYGGFGTNQQRWDSFHVLWQPVFGSVPVLNLPGNHEIESVGIPSTISLTTAAWSFPTNFPFQSYSARFPTPGTTAATPFGNITESMFYATVLGGIAKLISINNYIAFQPGSRQYNFVLQELRSVDRRKTPWLIVMYHTSTYHTYTNHYKSMECFLSIWEGIFYQYGVDFIFNGHVHAYERTHPVYKYRRNNCGPMYITVGDGGNAEGLYRTFVDDIDPSTNKAYCEAFQSDGLTPAEMYHFNSGFWESAGPLPVNCPTLSFQPPSGVAGTPPVMTLNVTGPMGQRLGFCQSSQPTWSAHRDPSFGHAILDVLSDTTARFRWFKNLVGNMVAVDDVVVERRTACVSIGLPQDYNLRSGRH